MIIHKLAVETQERLDRLYFCKTCGMAFLFKADRDDHAMQSCHEAFVIFSLEGRHFESQ